MLKALVICNIFSLVYSLCILREDHQAFFRNVETLYETNEDEFLKNSNKDQYNLGYDYCKCKEESSDFLTDFCISILEGHYSRNRKMLSGIRGGANNRGRDHLYIRIILLKNLYNLFLFLWKKMIVFLSKKIIL